MRYSFTLNSFLRDLGFHEARLLRHIFVGAAVFGTASTLVPQLVMAQAGPLACLITLSDTDPFFVSLREAATIRATELGVSLKVYASKDDGDNNSQVAAIETCIADGAKGILITPSDAVAVVPSVRKARDAGILVVALDTSLDPSNAADATIAIGSEKAAELVGMWTASMLGEKAEEMVVGFVDDSETQQNSELLRNQGFLKGLGEGIGEASALGSGANTPLVSHEYSNSSSEGARKATEKLLSDNPHIDVIHVDDGWAALGAFEALKAVGKVDDVLIVSADGDCQSIKGLTEGMSGAVVLRDPRRIARLGIESVKTFSDSGSIPVPLNANDFSSIGLKLVQQPNEVEDINPVCEQYPELCRVASSEDVLDECK